MAMAERIDGEAAWSLRDWARVFHAKIPKELDDANAVAVATTGPQAMDMLLAKERHICKVMEEVAQEDLPAIVSGVGIPRRPLSSFSRDVNMENVLLAGRWGVRGTVSMHISTTGTGKSVLQTQSALCFHEGLPCCGLTPTKPFRTWVIQSEDDDDRVAWDRDDIVEHLKEVHPGRDWDEAARDTLFLDFTGKTGADFLQTLDAELCDNPPDCVIINPMNAYFGGSLKEGADCSAFFKGGKLNGDHTDGLEAILKRHNVWGWIFSHTGKPPTADQLKAWLNDPFSAYKMCGASEIADTVRSIMTFLKVPEEDGLFSFNASKNGNGLGWTDPNGMRSTIMFARWGDEGRHYWEDVEKEDWPAEYVAKPSSSDKVRLDAEALAARLMNDPVKMSEITRGTGHKDKFGMSRSRCRAAFALVKSTNGHFGLACRTVGETEWWGGSYALDNALEPAF